MAGCNSSDRSLSGKHVCIVTTGHPTTNPRAVKEADALVEEGCRVTMVHGQFLPWATRCDDEFSSRAWARIPLPFGPQSGLIRHLVQRLWQEWNAALVRFLPTTWTTPLARSLHPVASSLMSTAKSIKADMYIAHNLAALPAAGLAASRWSAVLGFDAEDDHVEELPDDAAHRDERDRREHVLRTWIPVCRHLTASSPLIAQSMSERFGRHWTPVLNVFPLPVAAVTVNRIPGKLRAYWYSQTIGPDRGLEEMIDVFHRAGAPIDFTLRGRPADAQYLQSLEHLSSTHPNVTVHVAPPESPGRMVELASLHDFGVCSERENNRNKSYCLANKIFEFLAAGLPVVLSDTPAHRLLAKELGIACLVLNLDDLQRASQTMLSWLGSPERLKDARTAAIRVAIDRFNWDVEKIRFIQSVQRCLAVD